MSRKLLVIDTSYAYDAIVERQLQDSVTCRDLGGFFEHVWTVHPFASVVGEAARPFGVPDFHEMNGAHTFIDGKIGRFDALRKAPMFNFLASQGDLVVRLTTLIRREGISAIRAGDPLYNGLLGLFLARSNRIPLVVRVNANFDKMFEATGRPTNPRLFRSIKVEKRVLRFVLSNADLVAAVNQDNLDFAIAYGARRGHSTIFRYGNLIDKRHVVPPETRDKSWSNLKELWPEPCRFMLHVGRLESIKRPADPIRVLGILKKRGVDVKLVMVGDGVMHDELVALARELGVANDVAFVGNRGQEWLAQVTPLAAVVLSPITGRALTEAAFGAAPIVAYDLDWQGELIRTGETGELVPPSPEPMADAAERLLRDPAYARAMGNAVRKRAFEMLDPATLDQHERDSYTKLFER